MDAEENQMQVSLNAHSPWKSLRDSHIPTAATKQWKVENQKQVSHFPLPTVSLFRPNSERRPGGGAPLLLQAHCSIRNCSSTAGMRKRARWRRNLDRHLDADLSFDVFNRHHFDGVPGTAIQERAVGAL